MSLFVREDRTCHLGTIEGASSEQGSAKVGLSQIRRAKVAVLKI
nr:MULTISPECIES: hypothetical protein [unclassified Variovorax]